MIDLPSLRVTNLEPEVQASLRTALQRWADAQVLTKIRMTLDGELHPADRQWLLNQVRDIVRSYGEELDGELVLFFDSHRKRISIETRK